MCYLSTFYVQNKNKSLNSLTWKNKTNLSISPLILEGISPQLFGSLNLHSLFLKKLFSLCIILNSFASFQCNSKQLFWPEQILDRSATNITQRSFQMCLIMTERHLAHFQIQNLSPFQTS